jgi:hypothetical protein
MEDTYTKTIEYLIVVTHTLAEGTGVPIGIPMVFDDAAQAKTFAKEHVCDASGYRVIKKETSYVCASADDFWDEVDCEITTVMEVKHDPQVG